MVNLNTPRGLPTASTYTKTRTLTSGDTAVSGEEEGERAGGGRRTGGESTGGASVIVIVRRLVRRDFVKSTTGATLTGVWTSASSPSVAGDSGHAGLSHGSVRALSSAHIQYFM